jgi:hypothetical protein
MLHRIEQTVGQRQTIVGLLAVIATSLVLIAGPTTAANAAGPATIDAGADVIFPTWFWSGTKVCAQQVAGVSYSARVRVDPFPYDDWQYDEFGVTTIPWMASCITRSWFGNPVKVINRGTTRLKVWTS